MCRTGLRRRAEVRRRTPAGTGRRPIGRPSPADGGPGRGSASAQGRGTWRAPAGSSHHRPTHRRHLARGFTDEGLIPKRCRGPARHLEPRRSSQLSQVSESGFLREGTRLRRVEGVRQARARNGRRACIVGLRRSLARHLEPRRSSQLSQVSESGFLREGTRLRRVEGVRQARARKGCRACLVGLRRSLARHLSRRESGAA